MGRRAFYNCSSLQSIVLSKDFNTIENEDRSNVFEIFNKKYIIHKDGDRSNNKASNLIRVNFNEIRKNFVSGEIYKYSLSGEFLEKFATLKEASIKSGVNRDNLSKKLNSSKGQMIKYKNYLWERK